MKKIVTSVLLTAVAVLGICGSSLGQGFGGPKYAVITASVSPAAVHPGGSSVIIFNIVIKSNFHINSAKPNDPDLIPTKITIKSPGTVTTGLPQYPAGKSMVAPMLSNVPLSVYVGTCKISVPLKIGLSAKPGKYLISASVQYQGCNTSACYPPKTDDIVIPITVN